MGRGRHGIGLEGQRGLREPRRRLRGETQVGDRCGRQQRRHERRDEGRKRGGRERGRGVPATAGDAVAPGAPGGGGGGLVRVRVVMLLPRLARSRGVVAGRPVQDGQAQRRHAADADAGARAGGGAGGGSAGAAGRRRRQGAGVLAGGDEVAPQGEQRAVVARGARQPAGGRLNVHLSNAVCMRRGGEGEKGAGEAAESRKGLSPCRRCGRRRWTS